MELYMVGVYKRGNSVTGFVMLDPNTNDKSQQVRSVEYNQVINAIRSKMVTISNLRLENGKLKGYNGSIDRYGVVGKSQALVILRKAIDQNNNMLGFICSDCNGNMRLLSEQQVIGYANNIGLANGKVVNDQSGKSYISAIEGTYKTYTRSVQPQNNNSQQQKTQQQALNQQGGISATVQVLIKGLMQYPQYKGSFAEKVVATIKKTNKCTQKQEDTLKKILINWDTTNKENEALKLKEKQAKDAELEREYTQEQVVNPNELFDLSLMNGQLYIEGLKEKYRNQELTIEIPDTMAYNGRVYKVEGILSRAFGGSNIVSVKCGHNIKDIGQEAFMGCKCIEAVYMINCNNPHIPMRCFAGCESLNKVYLGQHVTRIHESAFENCKYLTYICLPESVETIARIAFLNCIRLEEVESKVVTIHDSAFKECWKLKKFDFSNVQSVGSQAFRYTAFQTLELPGTITSIGSKAFSDIYELKEVTLGEGIENIDEYCFAKPNANYRDKDRNNRIAVDLENITACRTLKEIGAGAFRHTKNVNVYTGSVAESHCIGFDVPYTRLDDSNLDNSTKVRIKSELMDNNPMHTLYQILISESENASNPNLVLNTSKLVDIPFNQQNFGFFGIEQTTEQCVPHAKFIGLVNYLQDVGDLFQDPLSGGILRLQKTFSVTSEPIYNDGCNRIYKVIYSLVDTLDEGGFIMVIMNNHLRFVTELTIATDVHVDENKENNQALPIKKFIHTGDKIGKTSTISGHNGIIEENGEQINVGEMFFNTISAHSIEVIPQRKDSIWYVPAVGLALKLHDKREWEKDSYSTSGKKIARNSQDCLNVLAVMEYPEFLEVASNLKKHSIDSNKFFKQLNSMTQSEVNNRIASLADVEEEKEAALFQVSKQFRALLDQQGIEQSKATPNNLTEELFKELSQSYWMVEKDLDWLRLTGKKSLNRTNEYTVGNYKLVEYKSNQVVKFSNPYMNGQKGACVFTLENARGNILGVYASRHTMQGIITKLVDLTTMKPSTQPVELMTDAYNIDLCDHDLFYNFYDVLYTKDGWSFKSYSRGYNRYLWTVSADFHIAMYKPTGIFYLTMESFVRTPDGDTGRKTMPILPIGNMDRALMIATTTNSKNKDSKLLEELMVLTAMVLIRAHGSNQIPSFKFEDEFDINAYFKARELAMQGVKDITQYKKLVNDRVVYMLGTVHKGVLQRENHEVNIEIDVEDESLYAEYGLEEDDIDVEDIDIEDEEEYFEDEEEYFEDEEEYTEETEGDTNNTELEAEAIELQKQLKSAGHDMPLWQVKLMLKQQLNK